jgi:Zinc finger C-x8-C-x5-C-x3-H type (and similar)/RNA-binding, Nab2-type zinc finger
MCTFGDDCRYDHIAERRGDHPLPDCKHWMRSGTCTFGAKCKFAHRDEKRNSLPSSTESKRANRKRFPNTRNNFTTRFFRHFLIDLFGVELLRAGSGVLDVAGGKGHLSFELTRINDINATLLDPRVPSYERVAQKIDRGYYARNPTFAEYDRVVDVERSKHRVPGHIRFFFDDDFLDCLQIGNNDNSNDDDDFKRSDCAAAKFFRCVAKSIESELVWSKRGLISNPLVAERLRDPSVSGAERAELYMTSADDGIRAGSNVDIYRAHKMNASEDDKDNGDGDDQEELDGWLALKKQMLECSAVVGLHPDQAAGAIVDFALAHGKPFALVPCCVYSRQFRKRQLIDPETGAKRQVTSYNDLLDYLQSKHPDIRRSRLPFEGKNIALFWSPTNRFEREVELLVD